MPVDRAALLAWYAAEARSLPWRERPTAYGVWLCEVMSQQTRIATMLPYWRRFQERWPTVEALAAAELDEVLGEWAGLGYYSRARRLHEAAAVLAEGGFPRSSAGLRELPGIGAYTAAAIASIVFDEDVAAVDGNVERVICRVEDLAEDPRRPAAKRRVQAHATAWLPRGRAGDWNQAVMELGARVCTPKNPGCGRCPLAEDCRALEAGTVRSRPNKPRRQRQLEVSGLAAAVRGPSGTLLGRRPLGGLLGGLWELPWAEDLEALERALGPLETRAELGTVRHVFTHRKLTLRVVEARLAGPPAGEFYEELRWLEDPGEVALSTLARKALALLEDVEGLQD